MSLISTLITLLILNFSALGILHSAMSALIKTKQAYYDSYSIAEQKSQIHKNAGFTITSLMLNLLLTSITTLAIISLLIALKNIYSQQLAWARLQENARTAMQVLENNKNVPMPFFVRENNYGSSLYLKRGGHGVEVVPDVTDLTLNYHKNKITGNITFKGPGRKTFTWPITLEIAEEISDE